MTSELRLKRPVLAIGALAFAALWPASFTRTVKAAIDDAVESDGTEPTMIFSTRDATGGSSVHLPALVVTEKGTVLALCQLRKGDSGDWSHETDILVRRSEDGGRSWSPVQVAFADPRINAINGPIVEDRVTKTLVLPFTRVPITVNVQPEWIQYFSERGGSVCVMTSTDEGRTWSTPVETKPLGRDGWIAWAGNNLHGIQLASGRLVIPGHGPPPPGGREVS